MLHLRVFGSRHTMAGVVDRLFELGGARHITRTDTGHDGGALWTLAAGLACVWVIAGLLTALFDSTDLLPASFAVGESTLQGLTTVNSSTFIVAFAAGTAGMLALETRASSAVGVAISVATIPASAYLGVAAGVGEVSKAAGAAAVLGINVLMLTLGGTAALLAQRTLAQRPASRAGPS